MDTTHKLADAELRKTVRSCLKAAMSIEHERMVGRLSPQAVGEQLQKTEDRLFELLATPSADQATQPAEAVAWMQSKPAPEPCIPAAEILVMTDAWKRHLLNEPSSVEFANSHDIPLYTHPAPTADQSSALHRYLSDTLASGTANEQIVARTTLKLLADQATQGAEPVAPAKPLLWLNPLVADVNAGRMLVTGALTWSDTKAGSWTLPLYTHPAPASASEPEPTPDWLKLEMLLAAAKSDDAGAMRLAAQLADCAPCPTCDFVKSHCRCASASVAGAGEAQNWYELSPPMLVLGRTYMTRDGRSVTMTTLANAGTEYESMADEHGHHRYSRSHDRIVGRLTGSPKDDPGNIVFDAPPALAARPVAQDDGEAMERGAST